MNELAPIDLSILKKRLRVNFSSIEIQEVNGNKLEPESRQEFAKELAELGLVSDSKAKKMGEVMPMRLVSSIDPHEDDDFVEDDRLLSHALVIVFESTSNKKHKDSLYYNYFYTKKNGFFPLKKGMTFEFNAKQEHAVMVDGRVDLVTIWFRK